MDLPPPSPDIVPLTAECVQEAAEHYQVHQDILWAILMVEQGTVGLASPENSNGTRDIGPAQVNSIHLDALSELGVTKAELRDNGCLNVYVAARHLQLSLINAPPLRTIEDYMLMIARYHSKTPSHASCYALKLADQFELMYKTEYTLDLVCKEEAR